MKSENEAELKNSKGRNSCARPKDFQEKGEENIQSTSKEKVKT